MFGAQMPYPGPLKTADHWQSGQILWKNAGK